MFCGWKQGCACTETTLMRRLHLSRPDSILLFEWTRRVILSDEDLFKRRKRKDPLGSEPVSRLQAKESLDKVRKSFSKISVGKVSSGTFSPTLGISIGMGYVPPNISKAGT